MINKKKLEGFTIKALFLILIFIVKAAVASEYINFPSGHWVSQGAKNSEVPVVKVWSFSSGFTLLSYEKNGAINYVYSGAEWVWPDDLSRLDKDNEGVVIEKINDSTVIWESTKSPITFKKQKSSFQQKIKSYIGEWVTETYGSSSNTYSINIYKDGTVLASDGDRIQTGQLFIEQAGPIVKFDEVEPIYFAILEKKRGSFEVPAGEKLNYKFKKKSKKPAPRLIMDGNGQPMQIDSVSLKVQFYGAFVETQLEVEFSTPSDSVNEANFELPIPSDATVTGFALDVDGAMVPAVVVPKEEARKVFETMESRGVDPAIAEIVRGNQFRTEIYPIETGQKRKISVNYIESSDSSGHKGKFQYRFPLSEFGEINELKITIINEGVEGLHVISSPNRRKLNKEMSALRRAESEMTWSFNRPKTDKDFVVEYRKLNETKIISEFNGELFFYVDIKNEFTNEFNLTPKEIIIAWDDSQSMMTHHSRYVQSLLQIMREFPLVDVSIYPFSITKEDVITIPAGTPKKQVVNVLSKIRYDGASRLGLLSSIPFSVSKTNILFSDGLTTVGTMEPLDQSLSIIVVIPDASRVNLPLLAQVAINGELLTLDEKLFKKSLNKALIVKNLIPEIQSSSGIHDLMMLKSFGPNYHYQIVGKMDVNSLPQSLIVNKNGQTRKITLDKEDLANGTLVKSIWVNQMLQPLVAFPRVYKQQIIDLGMKYSVTTPFTSLISLDSVDDYAEFGILPPKVIDPQNKYEGLREKFKKINSSSERFQELVDEWSDRVKWWKDPLSQKLPSISMFQLNPLAESLQGSALEEVVVTGIRASIVQSPIFVEPWNPSKPYLTVIKSSVNPIDGYDSQRKLYGKSPAFYMDVAKYFFKINKTEEGFRVLSNVLEIFPEQIALERMVAYVLLESGLYREAISIFEFIEEIASYQANSKRDLAVAWEKLGEYSNSMEAVNKAISLYYDAALNSSDDTDGLPITALMEMNRLIARNKHSQIQLDAIDPRLINHLPIDLRAVLSWSSNLVDLDLHVIEPSGEEVFYGNRQSTLGAYLPYDDVTGFGPEEYLLKNAKSGEYKVVAHYYGGRDMDSLGEVFAKVDFYFNYARTNEKHEQIVVRLEKTNESMFIGRFVVP